MNWSWQLEDQLTDKNDLGALQKSSRPKITTANKLLLGDRNNTLRNQTAVCAPLTSWNSGVAGCALTA